MGRRSEGTERTGALQLLTPEGRLVEGGEVRFTGTDDDIRQFYRDMTMVRQFDDQGFLLQRQGQLALWAPSRGQEATQVGSARALAKQDMAFAGYRQHGVAHVRGMEPESILRIWRGSDLGSWDPADHGFGLVSIVVGSHSLHAVGYAMGIQLDGAVGTGDPARDTAVVAYLGDGSTSEGDVAEAFQWAAVRGAPVVFIVENNHYAISVPVSMQTAAPIADRARGYGFPGIQVDGNDALACHAVTEAALARARSGQGPTLIEALTFRVGPHTTSDDATRYRSDDEVEHWEARDPIARVRRYLESAGTPAEFFAQVDAEAEEYGIKVRELCLNTPEPDLAEMFDNVRVETPPDLHAQQSEYEQWRALEAEHADAH